MSSSLYADPLKILLFIYKYELGSVKLVQNCPAERDYGLGDLDTRLFSGPGCPKSNNSAKMQWIK